MASDINVFTVTGRLTRDGECSYTPTGTAVLKFSIAYTRGIKKHEKWEEKSCFIEAVLFGKRAEGVSPYLLKGVPVAVTGELDFQTWEDKETGKKRSKHSLTNIDVKLLGSKKEYTPQETATGDDLYQNPKGADFEDDITF
jgi:single-strand DNA-binding protein